MKLRYVPALIMVSALLSACGNNDSSNLDNKAQTNLRSETVKPNKSLKVETINEQLIQAIEEEPVTQELESSLASEDNEFLDNVNESDPEPIDRNESR